MVEIGAVISTILRLSASPLKNKLERQEFVIEVLKKLNIDPTHPPTDFDAVYAYSLVEFGINQPEIVLNFFRDKTVKDTFQYAFNNDNPTYFLKESQEILQWHELGSEFKKIDYDPRRSFAEFTVIFTTIVDKTRTPAEVRRDYKITDIQNTIQEIESKLKPLENIERLWEVLEEIKTSGNDLPSSQFSLSPTSNKLKVFISSSRDEFRDILDMLSSNLKERGIDVLIFNDNSSAAPVSKEEKYILDLNEADIFVGLYGEKHDLQVIEEYHHARNLHKPCFIYVRDQHIKREQSLETFLEKDIFNTNKGVTYSFFERALDLHNSVAEDIMMWFVRRHREMTAEIAQANLSDDEINKLKDEVKRLQASSVKALPSGTEIDFLSNQMRIWFDAIGYKIELFLHEEKDYFEWVINIPKRRGYDRILVQGIVGEIEGYHVVNLNKKVSDTNCDEGWVVSSRRVSQIAKDMVNDRKSSNVLCFTFDELLDDHADFTGYLDWLENEINQRQINSNYVPLACIKEEFDPLTKEKIGESLYNQGNGWVEGYIDRWLDDPAKKHISILGEFGTGKTWLTMHYASQILEEYRSAKERGVNRPRIPLVISLRDYAKAVSVESLFSEFFFRKHQIPIPHYHAFQVLNRMGKFILIFDGFDEMASQVDRQKMINNFWELAKTAVPSAKIILTCRTEHFPDAMEGRSLLNAELHASTASLTGEPPQFEVLQLQKFDDDQIRQVLLKRTNESTVDKIMKNDDLKDLVSRPIMTEYVLEALPEIENGKPIDLSRVYLYAVERKMKRDIKEERTFTSLADKLYFLSELSWEMLSKDQMSLNYRMFPDHLRKLFGSFVKEQKDLDHWHYDMMGQTMLIRNADGDYTPAHRSLLEFFVAYKFSAQLGILEEDFYGCARESANLDMSTTSIDYTWSTYYQREVTEGTIQSISPLNKFEMESLDTLANGFGKKTLSKAIIDIMLNMINKDEAKQKLLILIHSTKDKTKEECQYLGSNAATLLLRIDNSALRGIDLSGTDLSEADLEGANLAGTCFDNSNLSKCNLRRSTLKGASLRNCIMVDATVVSMNSWITGLSYPGDHEGFDVININYFNNEYLNSRDSLELPFTVKDDEIAISFVRDHKFLWHQKIVSDFIVEIQKIGDNIHILTIEGDFWVIDYRTGNVLKNNNIDTNIFRWDNADVSNVIGLNEENLHAIKILKAVNVPTHSYNTSEKRMLLFPRLVKKPVNN
ncbi:pentapeptide repeat-containing protein [Robertmurraya sp. P23]|uniref:pentapeptide repeat-containing protein n=1 Tax=Robertmurraya sp. P23 TaxID=3436931 RepID=UPI003D9882D2